MHLKSRKARKNRAIWRLIHLGFKCVDNTVGDGIRQCECHNACYVPRKFVGQRTGYVFKLDEKAKARILAMFSDVDPKFLNRKHFTSWHAINEFVNKYYPLYII